MFQCKHIHMNTYNHAIIPYKQKYWQCLILVWPQTNMIKILAKFKFEHCACVYQGVLPSSHLKYLKVCKFTRNITGSVLVLSWLYLQLTYWSASRGQERDCMHYVIMSLCVGDEIIIILADFILAVSALTAKLANSIKFSGYLVFIEASLLKFAFHFNEATNIWASCSNFSFLSS